MNGEDVVERSYGAIVAELSEEERKTVAESAAILASTADRIAQVEADGGAEGLAAELRRIADEEARIEELALSGTV